MTTKQKDYEEKAFKQLNDLTQTFAELGVITNDGDSDDTDRRVWDALNLLRAELQNNLHVPFFVTFANEL
jgi:hypothetical protein